MTGEPGKADAAAILEGAGVEPPPPLDLSGKGRLNVKATARNPVDVADEVIAEVLARNDPPRLFRMGAFAVLLHADGTLEPYDADRWLYHVARLVDFYRQTQEDGPRIVAPPAPAMKIVPPAVLPQLPVLDGVVHTPYLTADGAVVSGSGYNPRDRLALHAGKLKLPGVPEEPTPEELAAAVKLLTEEWLGDFPFAADADRANAVALLLTVTGRAFFGLAPMIVLDASTSGSGKGLLISTVSLIASGSPPSLMELPSESEEQRKKITTALLAGNDVIVWDESHVIAGRTLAMILTAEEYSDRLLGGNKMISVRNRFTQVALGNNVQVWGDMKRRVVASRLEPDTEHPEQRSGFRHANLLQWVRENRRELLAAVLTIWRAWIAADRPMASVTMGSFERWAGAIGGALTCAGIPGFLANATEWIDDSDPDADSWVLHLATLRSLFGEGKFTAQDIAGRVDAGTLRLPYFKRDPDKSMPTVIGNMYRSVRGKWHGDYRLDVSPRKDSPRGGRTYTVTHRDGWAESEAVGQTAAERETYPQDCQESQSESHFPRSGRVAETSHGEQVSVPPLTSEDSNFTETPDSPDTRFPAPASADGPPWHPCINCRKMTPRSDRYGMPVCLSVMTSCPATRANCPEQATCRTETRRPINGPHSPAARAEQR